jgi:hypothetical protein
LLSKDIIEKINNNNEEEREDLILNLLDIDKKDIFKKCSLNKKHNS